MEKTKNGRDINRHYYTLEEIAGEQERPVVRKLKKLMAIRNMEPAFHLDGKIQVETEGERLMITRKYKENSIRLSADLRSYGFEITRYGKDYENGKETIVWQ